MPAELLLVGNPRKRHRKAKSRRRPSAKQRANWARFAARARARSHSRRAPRRRRARLAANPIRHRARRRVHHFARHRRRRNSIGFGSLRGVVPMLKSASTGAVGAIVNDIGYGFAIPFLPAMMSSPVATGGGINPAYYAGKLGNAFLLGFVAKKIVGARAVPMIEGALTVTLRDALKQALISFGVPVPMGSSLNPGRIVPPLPIAQNLRKYIGPTAARGGGVGLYVVGERSTSAREMMTR
jgi:hypothetical protein